MRLVWAIAAGLLLGTAAAWWFSRTPEPPSNAATTAATQSPAPLYRWRDEAGVLHITDHPPAHGRYEHIDRHEAGSRVTPLPAN